MAKTSIGGSLRVPATVEEETVNVVQPPPEWEAIDFAVDSGASETVMGEGLIRSVEMTPSAASLRGVKYEVANGERIPNLGEKHLRGLTDREGYQRQVTAQVCDVSKPLMSVAKLVATGNTVVFTKSGSYIENDATAERTWLREEGGMYMARLWIPANPAAAGF